ncbi:hypothetical protein [Streptomyces gibsoniae]|uniref:Secreted protein n=1 Tax=Streptomyces gibsoniae TaxID=3075529 RepID=A0ABU2UA02_9ACTN|nr:hypothetical protein [Streptomyces sp. DSM 41699]MDT0470078.1 hypothetical protein [Streptomyces sp. DSM 41699]
MAVLGRQLRDGWREELRFGVGVLVAVFPPVRADLLLPHHRAEQFDRPLLGVRGRQPGGQPVGRMRGHSQQRVPVEVVVQPHAGYPITCFR